MGRSYWLQFVNGPIMSFMEGHAVILVIAYALDVAIVVLGAWEAFDPESRIGRWIRGRRGQTVRLGRATERDAARSVTVRLTSPIEARAEMPTPRVTTGEAEPPSIPETVDALRRDIAGIRSTLAQTSSEREKELRALDERTRARLDEVEERWARDLLQSEIPSWQQRAIPWLAVAAVFLHIAAEAIA